MSLHLHGLDQVNLQILGLFLTSLKGSTILDLSFEPSSFAIQKFFTREKTVKWLVFVVLITADGTLEKKYNSSNGWEDLNSCINFVTSYTPIIIEDLATVGILEDRTLLAIGCYDPTNNLEELVVY